MSKLTAYLSVIGPLLCLSSLSWGQTLVAPKSMDPNRTATPFTAKPLPVVAPNDFKTTVTQLGQETQKNLSQQLNQTLKPLGVQAPKQPTASEISNAQETSKSKKNNTNKQPETPAAAAAPVTSTTTTAPVQAPPAVQQPPPVIEAPPLSTPATPPYTGFGTGTTGGSTTTTTPKNSQSSGGGLNIKY